MSRGPRRLAAIMFTDMAGYTALGQRNESLSLAALEEQRRLVRPILARHNGREVKTIGDAFLVEFPSAVDAVRCAYDIQRTTREFNFSLPEDRRIHLRIGIHLGEVVEDGGDILGDAVNVASRIEKLSQDGGVCFTRPVQENVLNKVDLVSESLGPRDLKGVSGQTEIYRLVMPWEGRAQDGSLDPKRVAVLPFSNMSPDPNDEFFADGLTEELIDRLAQVKDLKVIARTSVMSYKKKDLKAGQIGRELRAGALVEGSIRKAGTKIRVTAQLIDVESESHLWSSRYDRDLQDVFAVQTDIAEQVAGALKVQLVQSERTAIAQKPTDSLDAYTLYLRGRFLWNKRDAQHVKEALALFQQAAEKDPAFARAFTGIADSYSILVDRADLAWDEAGPKAMAAAETALRLDPELPEAHASMGLALVHGQKLDAATREFERAIQLNPGYASAYQWYSINMAIQGKLEEADRAIEMAEKADPMSAIILYNSGYSAWYHGRDSEALEKWARTLEVNPEMEVVRWALAGFYIQKGRRDEALAEIRKIEAAAKGAWGSDAIRTAMLAMLKGFYGLTSEARALAESLLAAYASGKATPSAVAFAYAGLGDFDRYFEFINKSYHESSALVSIGRTFPLLAGVRADPRFQEYLAARDRATQS